MSCPTPDPRALRVVGAAILDGPRCLATQRSETMPLPLKWEFPGGKIGPGESPEEALRREVEEELGIVVTVGEWIGRGNSSAGGREVVLDVYTARLVAGTVRLAEHQAWGWFDLAGLQRLDWAEADVPVLPALFRRLT